MARYCICMKKILFGALMLPLVAFAQHIPVKDSLQRELANASHDTVRVQILKKLAWEYYFSEPAKAPAYALQMIHVAEKAGYLKGTWDGCNIMGVICCTSQKYDSAITWLTKALSLSEEKKYYAEQLYSLQWMTTAYRRKGDLEKADLYGQKQIQVAHAANDPVKYSKAYKNVAGLCYDRGDYVQSLALYLKADSILGDRINIDRGEILQNIGQIYHVWEDLKLEKKYLSDALTVYEKLNDDYGISTIALTLGNTELQSGNYEKARDHFLKALSFFEHYNDEELRGNIYRLLGSAYHGLNDQQRSLEYYNQAIAILKNENGDQDLAYCYWGLGNVYISMHDLPEAVVALDTAYEKAVRLGDINLKADILQSYTTLHHQQRDYRRAFETQQQYLALADSISKIKSSKVVAEMEAKYQNERKQQEIGLLAAQNRLQQQEKVEQRTRFIVAIAGVLILAAAFYFLFITKQKANRKLKELDELKSRFFANISHEFRTPLTLISGPIGSRLRDPGLAADVRSELEMIDRNAQQLLSLVGQLLDLSKLESGGVVLRIESGDISTLLKTLASSFQYLAHGKSIQYDVSIAGSGQDVWYDQDVVQKIVTNLLANAIKYTPENGTVGFSAEIRKGELELTVSNSGEGIPEHALQNVFGRFFQVNGQAGGIGIGLALVKELADFCGGSIAVRSTPGQLTTFTVILPVAREAYTKAFVRTTPQSSDGVPILQSAYFPEGTIPENGNGLPSDAPDALPMLLVVEDNADVRAYIKSILHDNYQVMEAVDGRSGIALALEHIPDLILSDVMMPGTDGITLCRTLKTDERTSHIPIIMLTAKAGEEHVLVGFETGADDYITKPFNSALLMVRIRKLIELRKKLHERYSEELVLKPQNIILPSTDKRFMERVQQILDTYISDSDFNMETFAFEAGMSRMQLHRKLKGLTGLSANAFIRSHRLKMAASLLTRSGVNISEIGYSVGFSDPSYFAKCFKEAFHCTPTEFATKNQAESTTGHWS